MSALAFAFLLPILGADSAPEVQGLIATRIKFVGDARVKVVEAILDLLASCAHSDVATEESWLDAQRQCHLHLKFPKPLRAVKVYGAEKIEVAELVITFPLPSTGGIWVRSGDRYAYFAKYSCLVAGKIQELLCEAKPAE